MNTTNATNIKNAAVIKVLIADDEMPARALIREYLQQFPECHIVAEAENGAQCVTMAHELKPDVVFMDVQMPVMTGLEALQALITTHDHNPTMHLPMVIFSTAYDHYALQAFEVNAVDYLLKPYTKERFAVAVGRALARLSERVSKQASEQASEQVSERSVGRTSSPLPSPVVSAYTQHLQDLQALLQTLQHHSTIQPATHDALPSEPLAETLMVRHGGKILTIRTREIAWIEAADDYAVLHVIRQSETAPQTAHQTTQYLASTNLSALEQRLPAQLFKRVHRSTVLNISFIRHLEADPSGSMTATMLNGSKLKVSRSYAPALKKLLV